MKNFENKAKIKKVSEVLRGLLLISLWFAVGSIFILELPRLYTVLTGQKMLFAEGMDDDRSFVFYLCVRNFTYMFFWFPATFRLYQFFDRLAKGRLFDAQTVAKLNAAGRWQIAAWLIMMLFHDFGLVVYGRLIGEHSDGFSMDGLWFGLTIIFTAWLFREAQNLEEDQELTV